MNAGRRSGLLSGRLRLGTLGWNTIFGATGLGVRAVIQAAYLVLLSRWLGAAGYGLFAGSIAATMLLAPLAGWGATFLVTRRVAGRPEVSRAWWATAITQTAVTGALLTGVYVLAAARGGQDRLDAVSLLWLGLAELVALPTAQAGTALCFALDRGLPAALAICTVPAGRLLAAAVVILSGASVSAITMSQAHFIGSLAGLGCTVVLVARVDGWPAWRSRLGVSDGLRQGTPYAIASLFNLGYLEFDKVAMLRLLGAAVVGPYTAAFRVMMVFVLPISALINASLPRMFAEFHATGRSRTLRTLLVSAVACSILGSVVTVVLAPAMPWIFGHEFAAASGYVLAFAPWPLLYALHQCGVAALTAFDRQRYRVVIEGYGLLCVVVLNLALLPRLGAKASIVALLVAEAAMAIGCWLAMMRTQGRSGEREGAEHGGRGS